MKSNDPKMIAYLPVMYCVNCTGAEEALMVMGWGVAVMVMGRWGGGGLDLDLDCMRQSQRIFFLCSSSFVLAEPAG